MLENRNLKLDLLALVLLATVIFSAAALLSYDAADAPGRLVFPRHAQPANSEHVRLLGRADEPLVVRGPWGGRVLSAHLIGRV
jgi:hypothetical protein